MARVVTDVPFGYNSYCPLRVFQETEDPFVLEVQDINGCKLFMLYLDAGTSAYAIVPSPGVNVVEKFDPTCVLRG